MNVSKTTSNTAPPDFQAIRSQFKQSMTKLSSALDSGDVSGAQSALASLKPKNAPAGAADDNNPIAKAFSSVSSALDKGDMSGAKAAFSSLKSELKNAAAQRPPGPPPGPMPDDASNSGSDGATFSALA
jgi:ribosomal protein S20